MPLSKLIFKPGINRDQTNYSSEGGWYDGDKIRFRSGYPEKIGGWVVTTFTQYVGAARSLLPWITSTGTQLAGVGTSQKIYVEAGTALNDITPIRVTFNTPDSDDCLATVDEATVITINITGLNATEGDYVTVSGAVDIGGVPAVEINKEHKVFNATANSCQFTVDTPATSTVSAGGGNTIIVEAQINIGFDVVTEGFGYGTGTYSRGTWGSSSITPIFSPARLVHQETFNDDLLFNIRGGDIFYWAFSLSPLLRAVYLYDVSGAVAVPRQVTKILFASTGHLLALGGTNYDATNTGNSDPRDDYLGTYDPLLIRWANVDSFIGPEPENWQPTLNNTAGFFRLETGSQIITGLRTRQEVLVWTDTSVTSIQFLGTEEVFGKQEMSSSISILGPNTVVEANNVVYWMGIDKFYSYSGRVDTIPCTVRQYVFGDINRIQGQLAFAGTNNQFNEIIWFYVSGSSNTIDRYVVYNYSENLWYYGQLNRTAWADVGVRDYPLAASEGWIYEHENGTDDGQPLGAEPLPINSYIQSADVDIDDGDKFMLIRRVIPDVNFTGSSSSNSITGQPIVPEVTMTVGVRNFPGAAVATTNASNQTTARDVETACANCSPTTAIIDQYTNQVFVRARGRQMNFRINSNTVGTQWQLGAPRVDARPDGTRG
jgi:hypothetical protein